MKLRSYPAENEAINKDAPNKMEKKNCETPNLTTN